MRGAKSKKAVHANLKTLSSTKPIVPRCFCFRHSHVLHRCIWPNTSPPLMRWSASPSTHMSMRQTTTPLAARPIVRVLFGPFHCPPTRPLASSPLSMHSYAHTTSTVSLASLLLRFPFFCGYEKIRCCRKQYIIRFVSRRDWNDNRSDGFSSGWKEGFVRGNCQT